MRAELTWADRIISLHRDREGRPTSIGAASSPAARREVSNGPSRCLEARQLRGSHSRRRRECCRTPRGPVLSIPLQLSIRHPNPKSTTVFRNPMLYAMELRDRMLAEGINRAELARRLGVSRARITQWLELLELPEQVLRDAEALGDNWSRQVMTEREIRGRRRKMP
jgi:hypothetical protein